MLQSLSQSKVFKETRRFITVFSRVRHRSLTGAREIQSTTARPVYIRHIQISHLFIGCGVPDGLCLLFLDKILNSFLIISFMRATTVRIFILNKWIQQIFINFYVRDPTGLSTGLKSRKKNLIFYVAYQRLGRINVGPPADSWVKWNYDISYIIFFSVDF